MQHHHTNGATQIPLAETDSVELLYDYLEAHCTPEDEYMHRLYRATNTQLVRPRMASGHMQGILLRMIAQMVRPQTVLEIGTYSGYSALCLASGMEKGTKIYTFEVNDEQEDFTKPWFDNSPYPADIEMIIGDVLKLLPNMDIRFDLVFIDANKRDYRAYYDLVFPRLNPGGVILADNTLWDNHVIDPAYDNDVQTKAIKDFNDYVVQDSRVEKIILPLRDGLTMIRKK